MTAGSELHRPPEQRGDLITNIFNGAKIGELRAKIDDLISSSDQLVKPASLSAWLVRLVSIRHLALANSHQLNLQFFQY
jgi:hypothetical protein